MPNLLLELQRQRDDVLTRLNQAQLVVENLNARLASIDAILADMTRDAPTAMLYGAVTVDATGVTIIDGALVKAIDVQITPSPSPVVKPVV